MAISKYKEISGVLREEILSGRYDAAGKLPTEYELVSRFSVSRQTVRQAISCLRNDGYLYQIQGSGTYVSKSGPKRQDRTSKRVMVISTYISDYIFPSIIRGIEKELSAAGIQVSIAATGNRIDLERKILQNIIDTGDVDGIIAEGTKTGFPNPNISLYRRIKEMGIPLIFLHCSYPELDDAVVVGMNDMAGGRYIADYLIGKGYRKFGAIFKSDDRQGLLRYAGFCEGIINAGLSLDCVRPRWYTTEDVFASKEGGPDEVPVDYFTGDALVCYNDMVATAAITDYEKRGIPVPLILSFDSSHLCQAYPGRILSLGHRKDELGETAAVKMINMLSGKTEESVLMDWIC